MALSGGPDSTALLLALVELGRDVVAAHYDHALRPDSHRDAAHVAALCRSLGVRLVVERREGPLARGSLQAAARAARYDFLARARQEVDADLIATAHTADDQVETVLINLLRGTGVAALRGIPARRGAVVRPLLAATRAGVESYLGARGAAALRDPCNRDLRYVRARVRHVLLPALERRIPDIRTRILRLAALAPAAAERTADVPSNRLRAAYRAAGGTGPGLSRRQLATMGALLASGRTGATLDLPGDLVFRVLAGGFEFTTRSATVEPAPPALRERKCPGCDDEGAVHLRPGVLTIDHRRPGLRLRPLPHGRTRKLQDVLVDAKVPRHERDRLPLVFLDGRLAWVPGIAVDATLTTPRSQPGRHVELIREAS